MRDYVIFKFREINKHQLTSLINSEIYFAQPSCLNDPFDCRVEVLRSLDNAIIKAPLEKCEALMKLRKMDNFFENVQNDVSQFGVSSFSLKLNNTLMWLYYSNNHRGISLMYIFPESYFYDNKDRILGIVHVDYGTNPLTDWFIRRAPTLVHLRNSGSNLFPKCSA